MGFWGLGFWGFGVLPLAQAMARVFARLGEKNRNTARMKFLVVKLGIDNFSRADRSRARDARGRSALDLVSQRDRPRRRAGAALRAAGPDRRCCRSSFGRMERDQRLRPTPGGLLGSDDHAAAGRHHRRPAPLARGHRAALHARRATHNGRPEHTILRSVANADVASVHAELRAAGLGTPGANTIADPTSCPGTDTCKLGILSSRGLAAELRTRLAENGAAKTTHCATCASRSAAASIRAASTTSPTSASTASAATRMATPRRTSKSC